MSKYKVGDKFETTQYLFEDMKKHGFHVDDVYQGTNLTPVIKETEAEIVREEYLDGLKKIEPEVDWSKVEVDTPILVKEDYKDSWSKRYFAKYEDGRIYAWRDGATSWSAEDKYSWYCWAYAKLAEVEND